jgi:hypothetical protein
VALLLVVLINLNKFKATAKPTEREMEGLKI